MFFRLVTSVGQRKKILSPREESSDLRVPRSDALPLSHDTRPAYCQDQQCR